MMTRQPISKERDVGGRLAPQAVEGGRRGILLIAAPENTPGLKRHFLMFISIFLHRRLFSACY